MCLDGQCAVQFPAREDFYGKLLSLDELWKLHDEVTAKLGDAMLAEKARLEERLRRIGVVKALEASGFQPGDEVEIAGVTFALKLQT